MIKEHLRLIDANANRAREGLRTCEEFLRFSVGENRWSAVLKATRAEITRILSMHFSDAQLLSSRNSGSDPLSPEGGNVSSPVAKAEQPRATAQRGLKRSQEALRVLEEYLRADYPASSAELSRKRYLLYEIEQWLICASEAASVINASTIYVLLTEGLCKNGLLPTAEAALKGGARLLQLREKNAPSDKTLYTQASDLLKLCRSYGAVLICNDRPDVALMCGAPGVHVGQDDLSPQQIRALAAEKLIIGRSTHSVAQAKAAVSDEKADYIAIGSMYETATKQGRILAGLKLAEQVSGINLPVPVFAIGGITCERVKELKAAGIRRIAVSTAVIAQSDPESATKRLIDAMAL
ncbi:MAG TPA: thiamine phosphate synthase [Planctomycetota bacterium]|nr:thiamine phosphate synthase [Planctomycetota bacterium]